MPTDAHQGVLYRELARQEAEPAIRLASPLLREVVNYGTHLVLRCRDSSKVGDEDILIWLYLHILEVTDAIEVLLSQSCVVPAKPLLRSSFEALLQMEYMVEQDFERRAKCFTVHYMHERIRVYERLDPTSPAGQQLQAMLNDDKWEVTLPAEPVLQQYRANYVTALADPRYQAVEQEYQSHKRVGNWYQLFCGCSDLRRLAQHMKRGGQYEVLYRQWSEVTHGGDPARFVATKPDRSRGLRPLRFPDELAALAQFAVAFLFDASLVLVKRVRPEEEVVLAQWCSQDLKPQLDRL